MFLDDWSVIKLPRALRLLVAKSSACDSTWLLAYHKRPQIIRPAENAPKEGFFPDLRKKLAQHDSQAGIAFSREGRVAFLKKTGTLSP